MDPKPQCKYGASCYRKNPAHLNDFQHPDGKSNDSDSNEPAAKPPAAPVLDSPPKPANAATNTEPTATSDNQPKSTEKHRRSGSMDDLPEAPPAKKPAAGTDTTETRPNQKCFDENTDDAQLAEYRELVVDPPEFIRQKFMVHMPRDFYKLWEFCESRSQAGSGAAEHTFRVFGLELTGPYDVLAGKFDELLPLVPSSYLQHCRYYYDPPEFQTVLRKVHPDKYSGFHFGYWRDDPADENGQCFVAQTDESDGCEVTLVADNIFAAVINYLDKDTCLTPFVRVTAKKMVQELKAFAANENIALDEFAKKLRVRNEQVVCRTFHKAGLVVPVNRKTQVGYRPLQENDAALKKLLARLDGPAEADATESILDVVMEKLQPLITAANIAVDECDFGNSIELGIDLFCSGSKRLHAIAMQLLATGYSLVHRPQLIAILKAHLSDRRLGGPRDVVLEARTEMN